MKTKHKIAFRINWMIAFFLMAGTFVLLLFYVAVLFAQIKLANIYLTAQWSARVGQNAKQEAPQRDSGVVVLQSDDLKKYGFSFDLAKTEAAVICGEINPTVYVYVQAATQPECPTAPVTGVTMVEDKTSTLSAKQVPATILAGKTGTIVVENSIFKKNFVVVK
jgi:hypothetical protein